MKPLRFLFLYARNYTGSLIITVISMLLLVGVQLLIPWIIKTMVGAVTNADSDPISQALITRLALLALAVYIARAGLQFLRSYMAHVAGWGVVADARKLIYEHLQRLSLRFYEDKQTGQLMSRVVNDSDKFELLIAHAVPDVLVNALTLVGVTLVLLSMNWQLTLLSMVPIPLILLSLRAFAHYVRPAFRERQHELGELNAILADNLSGIREIKTFTREESELGRIWERIDRYRDSLLHALKMMAIFQPFIQFSSALGTIVIIYFGGRLILNQVLAVEELVAFFLYLELFYQPLHHLSDAWEKIQEALASAERVAELMEEKPEVEERPDAIVLPGRAQGAIRFHNVSFSYIPGEPVLQDINLEIPPHATVALVGPTGVGKTTLASLIPRFYDVTQGAITLDGYDLRDLSLTSLRRQISIVLQDVFLFHGTARDNILFGREDATEAEVIEAAKIANAHEFIMRLPDGYDTIIGERGVKLSGGQKQRLSIARAVLKDAPILILDEATSSVDTETERLIQQALERLMVGRTTIIIAHRLSTIRNADLIVVLSDGRIAECGTHQELMARRGLYWHLNQVQREPETPLVTPGRLALQQA
ncbi:ABC transporter ATP-binding protein/permease [Litorilinea aerophila]|uniref:ABC transporter ATP-binding protein n=1 Tax=Litorilinea aerophila TaxID=1204385 RepID=A0A540VL09_9CHLR|nr:ABC transporter ATP-binding protein [Litorilinea aerophila]MCC9075140.1 ABC transporter ATP-binding protein/permease [Litorilinea aerophila]GIV78140.1 MAG: ABC transporter permease [Litorilinea sp.]